MINTTPIKKDDKSIIFMIDAPKQRLHFAPKSKIFKDKRRKKNPRTQKNKEW